jgi:hypothetical protein
MVAPDSVIFGTIVSAQVALSRNPSCNQCVVTVFWDGFRDYSFMDGTSVYTNVVWIGYTRGSVAAAKITVGSSRILASDRVGWV